MVKGMVSIIVPARTEKFLNRTIEELLEKATGEIEIIPVLDGYELKDDHYIDYKMIVDPRVKYISLPNNGQRQKRMGINAGVSISKGEYVMWIDAHCAIAKGFDEVMARDCQDDWIMVPRRYKMNPKTWDREEWEGRPPIDYIYPMLQYLRKRKRIAGYRWDDRGRERKDTMIDEIMMTQGTLIFMSRKWYNKMGFMQCEGYTGWGQEGEECCLKTIKEGGRAVVNKNTWYAHLHKGQMHGRMYKWSTVEPSYSYSFNYWVHENKDFWIDLIEKNRPIPNYRDDWITKIYNK